MLLSSMDWQNPVLSSNMDEHKHSLLCLLCWAASLCWIFYISISSFFFCLFVAGSKPNVALTELQSRSTSFSPGLGNVYESAEWKQQIIIIIKKVLSKWPLWPNPCRAPAVFELFAWPRYERGLCWTVEPGDTGPCVCPCWCVCVLDVFTETSWEMRGKGCYGYGIGESFTWEGVLTPLYCMINIPTHFIFHSYVLYLLTFLDLDFP